MPDGVLGLIRDRATGRLVHWSMLLVYERLRCALCQRCALHPADPRRCVFGGPFDA